VQVQNSGWPVLQRSEQAPYFAVRFNRDFIAKRNE
jgi:hypothetical protein